MPELKNHPDFLELAARYRAKFGELTFSPELVPEKTTTVALEEMRRAIAGQRDAITEREFAPRPPVITSYYGPEKETRELDAILTHGGYELIDPPVSVYSSREEIETWIDELKQREQNEQIRFAIEDALNLLQHKNQKQ